MKKGCLADGLPEPEFDIAPTTFSVCFHIRSNAKAHDEHGVDDGQGVGVSVGVNETRRKILRLMSETPGITAQQIAEVVGLTKRRVESNIRALKHAGLLERVGADKNGYWVVKQPLSN